MNEGTRPLVAVVIVVALVGSVGWWWSQRDDGDIRLGDYGEVSAVVSDTSCGGLQIEVDGLRLINETGPLPSHWVESPISGSLHIEDRRGEDGVTGTFTAHDGIQVRIHGGVAGEYFFQLGCPIRSTSAGRP